MDQLWNAGRNNPLQLDLCTAGAAGSASQFRDGIIACFFSGLFLFRLDMRSFVTGSWMWRRSPGEAPPILFPVRCFWLCTCCLCSFWEGLCSGSRLRRILWQFALRCWPLRFLFAPLRNAVQARLDRRFYKDQFEDRSSSAGFCPNAEFGNKPGAAVAQHSRSDFKDLSDRQRRNIPCRSGAQRILPPVHVRLDQDDAASFPPLPQGRPCWTRRSGRSFRSEKRRQLSAPRQPCARRGGIALRAGSEASRQSGWE